MTIGTIITLGAIGLFALITLFSSFVITKQKEAKIIERFGKYTGIRSAGFSFKIPFIEKVAYVKSLRISQLEVDVETITQDKVSVHVRVAVQYYIKNNEESIKNAAYELDDFEEQIRSYVFNEIRAEVPKKKLDAVYENKQDLEQAVKEQLSGAIESYGYIIQNALVTDIDPDNSVKEAMNRINAAERDKIAAAEEGEAAKIRKVKAAEAEAESKALQGKGIAEQRDAIIRGFQESIGAFAKDTGINQEDVMRFVEITQYFDTMRDIAKDNNNVIFMPHSSTGDGVIEQYAAASIASDKVDDNKGGKKQLLTEA